jgi:hypothetical protein
MIVAVASCCSTFQGLASMVIAPDADNFGSIVYRHQCAAKNSLVVASEHNGLRPICSNCAGFRE